MAKKKPCPEFEQTQKGGIAPACVAGHICEEFCFKLKCDPTGATLSGLYEYDVDEKCVKTNETWKDADGAAIDLTAVVKVACVPAPPTTPPEPVVPITLDGTDCDGAALPATGNPGELVQIVQAPGQVLSVRFCSDDNSDFELSCGVDPANGHTIQTAYKIVAGTFELIKRWDTVTGAEWTGDPTTLEGCGGKTLESEQELFCDSGVPFLRWYVIEEGRPTGDVVDTDLNGQPYTVTNPAAVVKGECKPTCADEPIRDCNGSVIGYGYTAATALVVGATATMDDCNGNALVYLMAASDADHTIPIGDCNGAITGYAASKGCETSTVKDVEPVFMCDSGTTFIRHFVYLDGAIDSTYDTNTIGSPYTVSDEASVTIGACVAQCAPVTYQGVQNSW